MPNREKVLRCMLFTKNKLYIAACLDLTLAAQATTPQEAKDKLEKQIIDYLEEAFEDTKYTYNLLNRKAPYSWWFRYYCMLYITKTIKLFNYKSKSVPEIFAKDSSYHRQGA